MSLCSITIIDSLVVVCSRSKKKEEEKPPLQPGSKSKMMILSRLQLMSARAHSAASQPQARKLIFQTICQFSHPHVVCSCARAIILHQHHATTWENCHFYKKQEQSEHVMNFAGCEMSNETCHAKLSRDGAQKPLFILPANNTHVFLLLEPLRPEIITRVFLICYKFAAPSTHTQNITRISQRSRRDQKLTIKYYILFFHVEKTT